MKITIPGNYLKITGAQADIFRDKFARGAVAKEADGGPERAAMLMAADKYIIKMEQEDGGLHYRVALGQEEDSFVAIGPNLAQRMLNEAVPLFMIGDPDAKLVYA